MGRKREGERGVGTPREGWYRGYWPMCFSTGWMRRWGGGTEEGRDDCFVRQADDANGYVRSCGAGKRIFLFSVLKIPTRAA